MRVAAFVDAGYLYVAGAISLTGSQMNRGDIWLKTQESIIKLKTSSSSLSGGAQLLRIYWYDGLMYGRRSSEQEILAKSDDVKLRLGTVTAGRQKGVDSLIVTDLIELARNHAISDAVLLSGDEDLRIGVQIAQNFGVRVHLIGIAPSRGNQSNLLREEADTVTEWGKEEVAEILTAMPGVTEDPLALTSQDGVGERDDTVFDDAVTAVVNSIEENDLANIARELAATPNFIPQHYDRRLLTASRRHLGRDLEDYEKRLVRQKFREAVHTREQNLS